MEEGAALGTATYGPLLPRAAPRGKGETSWKPPPQGASPLGPPLAHVLHPHLGLPSEREPIDIKFINLIPKPFRNT